MTRSRYRKSVVGFLILALPLFAHMASADAGDVVRVFQMGQNGYAGVHDTWVSTATWDNPPQTTVNYGQNEGLSLFRNGMDNPLIRFDLGVIPSNSFISKAVLRLYNTTRSSYSGTRDFARRVQLHRVLGDWDEGNQAQSPVNAPGKHGATGEKAFDYYSGEGQDVPWTALGLASGSDYAATAESFVDVVNEGWYEWDVTALAHDIVLGRQANYGMVLRDASGYTDDHMDWRTFVSSQAAGTPERRPMLVVTYNPDTPVADAGADQEEMSWNGGAVTLDGSGSHDRPGGNGAGLTYTWRIVQSAYGSGKSGTVYSGASPEARFKPDVPGEWEMELQVVNDLGESATDRLRLRLYRISATHPRIYLTAEKLAALRTRAVESNPTWVQLKAQADNPDGHMHAKALVSQVLGRASYCDQAITSALGTIAQPSNTAFEAGDIALVYDWCHEQLGSGQKTTFIGYMNGWAARETSTPHDTNVPGWVNYWPNYSYSFSLVGLATYGDNPEAKKWLDELRLRRYRDIDLPLLDRIAAGGAWPEGMIYDWIANHPRVKSLEAWRTATGEDLFKSTAWYRERLGYLLLHHWPGVADQWGYFYHPYVSTGDTERNRASIGNYERIMALILIERFPTEPLARQLQAYLSAPPVHGSMSFLCHEEFLWFNPDQRSSPPRLLTHYAAGTGTLFMRSAWPSGAPDTNPSPTILTFQSGDHFTYHQHYDQNSFTLFKYGDLAVDSGVYSGNGLSYHDVNYYVRTIAHNTLVVFNPLEDFRAVRADAVSNDGGQRTVYPASRSPGSIEYYDQHFVHYDTGDMVRLEDAPLYTYARGDATKAYNNPTYNQAMDTGLGDNTAKVKRFQREFVYLRPFAPDRSDYVVIFDRVGVTQRAFSAENTKLLFHTLGEPKVGGTAQTITPGETLHANADYATAVSGGGKLFMKFLLPQQRNIRKVGGRDLKAFWVFGETYDWHWSSNDPKPRPVNDFEEVPYGEWRLELEPADTALDHNFLTVLHPAPRAKAVMPPTTLVTGKGISGAHIADPATARIVLFSSDVDGRPPGQALSYSFPETGRVHQLIVNLKPGARYTLATGVKDHGRQVTLTPDAAGMLRTSGKGVLSFTTTP